VQNLPIRFFFEDARIGLTERTALKRFLLSMAKREGKRIETINYIFTTDAGVLKINQTYLNHHFYTDIITFPLNEPGMPISADIYISIDRVRENASTFSSSIKTELHRVLFHGLLHLCGYNDKSKKEQAQMRQLEDKYLRLYFYEK
jgi:rRNA maturation RNase YbeY